MATQVDPAVELEALGLIPGSQFRPAYVLTGSLGASLTAVDIGIASPDAQALDRQNITYQPMLSVVKEDRTRGPQL